MTLESFLNLSTEALEGMTMKELRTAAHSGFATLNKRISRLEKADEIATDALDKAKREGGRFRQAGLDRDELIEEIQRAQRFGQSSMSTVKGARTKQRWREEQGLTGRLSDLIREALRMWEDGEIAPWSDSPKEIVDAVKNFVEENADRDLSDYTDRELVFMIFDGDMPDDGEMLEEWEFV